MSNPEFLGRGIDSIFLKALAHFIWQAATLGVCAAGLQRFLRNVSAAFRCALLMLCLLAMPFSAGLTVFILIRPIRPEPAPIGINSALTPLIGESPGSILRARNNAGTAPGQGSAGRVEATRATGPVPLSNASTIVSMAPISSEVGATYEPSTGSSDRWARFILVLYLAGVFLMLVRLCLGVRSGAMLRAESRRASGDGLIAAYARQLQCSGIGFTPELLLCRQVMVPAVVGILKPAILLPISICADLSIHQIELLLAHELAHIRRYDQVLDLIQRVVEALFFFHPAVWYVSLAIRAEREKCCDDAVVRQGHSRVEYASVLLRVAELSSVTMPPSMVLMHSSAGRQSQLRDRILRLIAPRDAFPSRGSALIVLAILLAVTICGVRVFETRRADAVGVAPTSQPAPYRLVYDNGAIVDVLAVSIMPSRHTPFWSPDGMRMIDAPYTFREAGYARGDETKGNFELVIRIAGIRDDHVRVRSRAVAPVSAFVGAAPYGPDTDLRLCACAVPLGSELLDFEIGIAANNWQVVHAFKEMGVYGQGADKITVTDADDEARARHPEAQFCVQVEPRAEDLRLVAIDQRGGTHISPGRSWVGRESAGIEGAFADLPREQVTEYRLEKCAVEWKRMRGIHLKPKIDLHALAARARVLRLTAQESKFQPAKDTVRIDDALETIDRVGGTFEDIDQWAAAVRDLSDIGAPAVPAIVAELRHTARPYARSLLAIALRAVDDPRAVPGLIDALRDCPFGTGDYGGTTKDPALAHFMSSLELYPVNARVANIGWQRPAVEIVKTLMALTNHNDEFDPFFKDDRAVYQGIAERWRIWWEHNQASFTDGLPIFRGAGDTVDGALNLAILSHDIARMKGLVDAGVDVNVAGSDGLTPLQLAAALGQVEAVQFLLDHKADPSIRTGDGCTALHSGLGLGTNSLYRALPDPNIRIVQLLLDHGSDPNAVNAHHQTALHAASSFADADIVKLLLSHGAQIRAVDVRGRTALHRAVECQREQVVDALLAAGADVNALDLTGRTPFQMGDCSLYFRENNSPIFRKLLDRGARVPLTTAIVLGSVEHLAATLKSKPDVNQKPTLENDQTPLIWAIRNSSPERVKLLLDAGADPNAKDLSGTTPLCVAAQTGNAPVVALLIGAKADVNAPAQEQYRPIHNACSQLNIEIVSLLLNAGATPSSMSPRAQCPIGGACQGVTEKSVSGTVGEKIDRAKTIIKMLLARGADVNQRSWGFTPIYGATGGLVEFLFQNGAKIDVADDAGDTPLHYAAIFSRDELLQFMLAHHASLEARNKKGQTALHCAVGYFTPEGNGLRLLLDAGADLSARDFQGRTPLHAAVLQGTPESVTALLDRRANVDAKDNDGCTPLHLAARAGRNKVISLLLTYGAKISAVDAIGRTPLQLAFDEPTRALLIARGAGPAAKK